MGSMSLDLFREVIDEAEGKCEAVTLASRGEPLMCRDIDKMLDYMKGKFLASKINTNAWFLDENKAHALLAANLGTIVFSVDAAEEPLYSQMRVQWSARSRIEEYCSISTDSTTPLPLFKNDHSGFGCSVYGRTILGKNGKSLVRLS
jgi:MoaA/NifB/PqqE/SkfB family radical SAM enzyme